MFSTKAKDNTSHENHAEIDALDTIIRDAELRKRELLEGPRVLGIGGYAQAFQPAIERIEIDAFNQMLNATVPNVITMDPAVFGIIANTNEDEVDDEERLKLMVIGHGRHGKDTVCEILNEEYGYNFISSSLFCADKVMYPISQKSSKTFLVPQAFLLPHYDNVEDCYGDRHNHRSTWYEAIKGYNEFDPTRLGTELYNEYDIYCGIRNKAEFHALRNAGVFDVAIWVDRSDHIVAEDVSSCTVEQWMADFTIDNNGDLGDLTRNVRSLMDNLHGG